MYNATRGSLRKTKVLSLRHLVSKGNEKGEIGGRDVSLNAALCPTTPYVIFVDTQV